MPSNSQFFGFLVALISVILLQFGFIFQKSGLIELKTFDIRTSKRALLFTKAFTIWVIGSLLTIIGALAFFYALTLGNLSQLQPLQGLGPLIIGLLSYFILKDKLLSYEWVGIFLSVIGLLFLTALSQTSINQATIDEALILIISVIILFMAYAFGFFIKKLNILGIGIFEGFMAGILAGFASVFAKIGLPSLIDSFNIHWAIFALIFSQITAFVLLQKGFSLGNVAKVASIFTITSILNPVFFGIVFFSEPFNIELGIGIVLILLGGILLSGKSQIELDSDFKNQI